MRDTKMVFQSYALFPHMTVAKNIGFGLELQKWPKEKIDTRVEELLSMVQMDGLGERTIDRISGGQQQRVALARALALEPKVLLLDEPLSNLDANLRVIMREELRHIQERIGVTTIFVTHDQYEAMSISDRILVLSDGVIQQIGSPMDIYDQPANEFIAGFVGYVNFLEGRVGSINEKTCHMTTKYGDIELDRGRESLEEGDVVVLVIRPENVSISPSKGTPHTNTFHGIIQSRMYAGNIAKYTVKFGDKKMVVDQYNPIGSRLFQKNDEVQITVPRSVHALKKKKNRIKTGG